MFSSLLQGTNLLNNGTVKGHKTRDKIDQMKKKFLCV